MKRNRLLVMIVAMALASTASAQNNVNQKVIYKWVQDGLVHYSHIKPLGIDGAEKLDAKGRKIQDFTEEFDEIVEIAVRPKAEKKEEEPQTKQEEILQAEEERSAREKNCATANKNMQVIDGGEVYERDSSGNLIRLTPEQVDNKRKNVQRDIDYFCGDS
ncbi:hypothetical protein [Ostreibacterium oceani]|uniref:DUF4124 domain-containing protein n=1 Tax=Ostreibacterium oceani TaxID=2654998 RepID=A0A6N7EVH5_9GAMM|nr:hypothetical protein [Ostreibacterium oceani]MPV86551.1 hypothetical protein [Ostreibacterium oceani]